MKLRELIEQIREFKAKHKSRTTLNVYKNGKLLMYWEYEKMLDSEITNVKVEWKKLKYPVNLVNCKCYSCEII